MYKRVSLSRPLSPTNKMPPVTFESKGVSQAEKDVLYRTAQALNDKLLTRAKMVARLRALAEQARDMHSVGKDVANAAAVVDFAGERHCFP